MKEVWRLKNKVGDFEHICNKFGISMPLARLLVNRNLLSDEDIFEYLHPDISMIPSYGLLKDIKKSVGIIARAIDNGEHIRIVGDYDVDGIAATFLLLRALEELGAYVSYRIPDRISDGYGISHGMIEEAIADGIDIIVTCDNGIAAKPQIEYAKEQGLTVIVTDHHDIPAELPPADCIINPKQADCDYPNKGICGAVVAAKLCEALFDFYGFGSFIEKNLDVMALATVCDVMELTGENRIIVKLGLEMINNKNNLGISALIDVNGLMGKKISAYHIGFVIGPCLNATGRLETADAGVELLRTDDSGEAKDIAEHLKELNELRKEKTQKGIDRAVDIIENSSIKDDSVIAVYVNNSHESIAGIIAGRIRERYNRPALVFTESMADEGLLKASGRSTESYNMFEGISACGDLLLKFGGHPMAAGLTIARENLDEFRKRLNDNCKEDLTAIPKKILIDFRLLLSYSDVGFVHELEFLEPMGVGNEKPVFADSGVTIVRLSRFGKESSFLKLDLRDTKGLPVVAKMFQGTDEFLNDFEEAYGERALEEAFLGKGSNTVNLIYYPEINEYNGFTSVQMFINGWMFPNADDVADVKENRKRAESTEKHLPSDRVGKGIDSKDGRCIIFCAGTQSKLPYKINSEDYVIAADGGFEYSCNAGVIPNEVIGDFDSLNDSESVEFPDSVKVTRLPVEKDDTDTAAALKRAIELGYKSIMLLGACGGKRIDHTFANISLLAYGADMGVRVYMFDEKSCMTVIKDSEIGFREECIGDLSVFAFGRTAEGVTENNLKYEIENVNLSPEIPLGVSNSFVGKKASVSVKSGKLLIIGDYLPEDIVD